MASERNGRFYSIDTGVVEEVPLKSTVKWTDEAGVEHVRSTTQPTIKHARDLGLLPSVSEIKSILHSHMLEDWKIEQAVKQCIETPWPPDAKKDDEDAVAMYIAEVRKNAGSIARDAADQGKEYHAVIYEAITSSFTKLPTHPPHLAFVESVAKYIKENAIREISCERFLASRTLGYAGTPDFSGHSEKLMLPVILDYKTVEMYKPDGKRKFKVPHDSWMIQLGAYENLTGKNSLLVQVVVDRATGETEFIPHKMDVWGRAFTGIFEAWCVLNNYDPRSYGNVDDSVHG